MSVPKYCLLGGRYPRRLIAHQQRYRPSDSNTAYWADDTLGDYLPTGRGIDRVIVTLPTGRTIPSEINCPPTEVSTE